MQQSEFIYMQEAAELMGISHKALQQKVFRLMADITSIDMPRPFLFQGRYAWRREVFVAWNDKQKQKAPRGKQKPTRTDLVFTKEAAARIGVTMECMQKRVYQLVKLKQKIDLPMPELVGSRYAWKREDFDAWMASKG